MNRFNFSTLILITASVAAMGVAAMAGGLPHTPGNTIIQNLNGIAPTKGNSGCVTFTGTKGTFGSYTSVKGFTGYEAEVVTAAGAAEPVQWELDGTQVAVGSSFKFTNNEGNTYSRAVQRVYSAPSRTLKSCTRRQ